MSFYSNGLGFWFGREGTELSEHDQVLSGLIYYIHTQITVEEGKIARSLTAALGVVVHFLALVAVQLPAACLKASLCASLGSAFFNRASSTFMKAL